MISKKPHAVPYLALTLAPSPLRHALAIPALGSWCVSGARTGAAQAVAPATCTPRVMHVAIRKGTRPAAPRRERRVGWSVAVLTQPPSCMPPLFGAASRCPRCNDRVYAAEQVIGPLSKMYHRHCLKCVVCQRRLDSVSLLEHDGEPYCSNCHRTHLGQGKDSFGTAVPVKPQHDPSTKSRAFKAVSDTDLHGRRPLPMAPSGSQEPLTVPASVSGQSGSSIFPTPSSAAGTPACARCHTPVCTCA